MGLRDVLFGRSRLKESKNDGIFALSTARVTLEVELGLATAGKAAVCFKPVSAGDFVRVENDIQELLQAVCAESESKVTRRTDDYGYAWIVVEDPDLEDLVTTVHAVAEELQSRGFGPQLLAAIFRFAGDKDPVYLIYGYKRGAFWPFVPRGDGDRDNAEELELKAKLENELPVEPDISLWFALFDAPV